jgi:hypothetical protein
MRNLNDARRLVNETNGQFFNILFVKKDGSLRSLNGRIGVKKHLAGGEWLRGHGAKWPQYMPVYDVKVKGYRTLNLETAISMNFRGVTLMF